MKWLQLSLIIAALLGLLTLVFPVHTQAQAGTETVTVPVSGMT